MEDYNNRIHVTENEYHRYDKTLINYVLEGNGQIYGRVNIAWKHLWKIFLYKLSGKVQILATPFNKEGKFSVDIIFKKRRTLLQKFRDWTFNINRDRLEEEAIKSHNEYRKNCEESYD